MAISRTHASALRSVEERLLSLPSFTEAVGVVFAAGADEDHETTSDGAYTAFVAELRGAQRDARDATMTALAAALRPEDRALLAAFDEAWSEEVEIRETAAYLTGVLIGKYRRPNLPPALRALRAVGGTDFPSPPNAMEA